MIEAKDILLIVLAFCALWFTAFLCWLIYQMAMMLKNVNDIVDDVHTTLGKMESAISGIRGRFDHAVSGLMLAIDAGAKIMDMLGSRKEKKAVKKAKKE